jgi:hypothetical protein
MPHVASQRFWQRPNPRHGTGRKRGISLTLENSLNERRRESVYKDILENRITNDNSERLKKTGQCERETQKVQWAAHLSKAAHKGEQCQRLRCETGMERR